MSSTFTTCCGGAVGGVNSLENYGASLHSKKKQELVAKLAEQLGPIINQPGLNKKSMKDIHAALKKAVGNPTNRAIKTGHKSVCQKYARAINNIHGMEIIVEDAEPGEVCDVVEEVLDALFSGMHSEFVGVAKDVKQRIKALELLIALLDGAQKKVLEIAESKGAESTEVSNMKFVMEEVLTEARRQMALLKHMLSISIEPAEVNVIAAMEKNKELKGFLARLGRQAGTQEFGQKLLYLLSGFDSMVFLVDAVDTALKDTGMTVSEYANTKKLSDLSDRLLALASKDDKSSKEMVKFMNAAELLKKNFYHQDTIVRQLKMVKGGARVPSSRRIDKRINDMLKMRQKLRVQFARQLTEHYNRLMAAIELSVGKVGRSVAVSDELDEFYKALERLDHNPDLTSPAMLRALNGEATDANARSRKNMFVKELRTLAKTAKAVDFCDISDAVGMIADLIESHTLVFEKMKNAPFAKKTTGGYEGEVDLNGGYVVNVEVAGEGDIEVAGEGDIEGSGIFGDAAAEKFEQARAAAAKKVEQAKNSELVHTVQQQAAGVGDAAVNRIQSEVENVSGELQSTIKGQGEATLGGSDDPNDRDSLEKVATAVSDLKGTFEKMTYAFRLAGLRQSLAKLAPEHDEYNKHYDEVLGSAIGRRQNAINKETKTLLTAFEKQVTDIKANAFDDTNMKKFRDDVRKMMTTIRNVRVKLVKTLEAIDIYLGAFADGLAQNPQDLGDIMKMLAEVKTNIKWYNKPSGDAFVSLFDRFASEAQSTARLGGNDHEHFIKGVSKGVIAHETDSAQLHAQMYFENVADRNTLHYWDVAHSVATVDMAANTPLNRTDTGAGAANAATEIHSQIGDVRKWRPVSQYEADVKRATAALGNITVLKNMVSMFISIGQKFGGKTLLAKCPMSPTQIYKNLNEYLAVSAYSPDSKLVDAWIKDGEIHL